MSTSFIFTGCWIVAEVVWQLACTWFAFAIILWRCCRKSDQCVCCHKSECVDCVKKSGFCGEVAIVNMQSLLKIQLYSKKSKKYSSFFAEKNETSFNRRGTYVPCLNLKTHDFTYWAGNNVPVDILLYYCCSLNRSSFFFLFVAFLSVLRHFFKAMLLVWCLLFTEPQECGYKGSKALSLWLMCFWEALLFW